VSHIEKACLLGQGAGIYHVFIKNRRFYVGVSNGMGSILFGLLYHQFRRDVIAVDVLRKGLRDLPVLAEFTLQIASCCCEGKGVVAGRRGRRLLLDRVEMNAQGFP